MTARGPADMPPPLDSPRDGPPRTGPAPEAAAPPEPAPEAAPPRPAPGPVLSLEERKAQRQRKLAAQAQAQQARAARAAAAEHPAPERPAEAPAPAFAAAPRPLPQPAPPARARARHWLVLLSFLLLVAAPVAGAAWYLWERASPRYVSMVGFSVRTEQGASPFEMLSGLVGGGASSSSSDTDILYRFIQSREIVEAVDARLDLRTLWAKGDPARDPLYAYRPPGTIEDLVAYWQRMVSVYNDSGTGLIDVEVQAFAPEDAQAIATAIYEESQDLINRLSDIAVEDTTRIAREELDSAVAALSDARVAMTRFRNETQIVDPATSLAGQMGLLSQLEAQLAQALIELDLIRQSAPEGDPRIAQGEARVGVIEARMEEERSKLGLGRTAASGSTAAEGEEAPPGLAPEGEAFADLVGEYERLTVDLEFAQQRYLAAMAGYDSAQMESRTQSRYLAAHAQPSLAERAEHPRRWTLTLLTALFAGLTWLMLTVGAYALRDRR